MSIGALNRMCVRLPYAIRRLVVLGAVALSAPCVVHANVDWTQFDRSFSIKVTGYRGASVLSDFPVLVRVSAELNDFKYSRCKIANGGDLRFSDADGNLLASEVDTWNPAGTSLVWVKIPSLSNGVEIKGFYGCSNPPSVNATDVWSNGYLGVWHLGDADNATQKDSTGNGFDFVCSDAHLAKVDLAVSAGAVGGAVGFDKDGSNQGVLSAADIDDVLAGSDDLTVEAWICRTQKENSKGRTIIAKRDTSGSRITFQAEMKANGAPRMLISKSADDSTVNYGTERNDAPDIGVWTHMAFTRAGADRVLSEWLNGTNTFSVVQSSNNAGPLYNKGSYSVFLGNTYPTASSAFLGNVDEVRISGVARSGDWVTATRDTIADADFVEYEACNDWTQYSHTFTVSFDGYEGSTMLENFPVLVRVSESSPIGFSYSDCKKEGGGDLCFSDENGNILASEVETWDPNGTSFVWVKVPRLTSSAKITGYYGWKFAPKSDASKVWDSDYVAVWHMNADTDSLVQEDSTANGCELKLASAHAERIGRGVSGAAGRAAKFDMLNDGKGGYKYTDNIGLFDGKDTLTLEFWTRQTEFADTKRRMFRHRNTLTSSTNVLEVSSLTEANGGRIEGNLYRILNDGSIDYVKIAPSSKTEVATPALSKWNHQVVRFDCVNNSIKGFMNGTPILSKDDAKFVSASSISISDSQSISIKGAVFVGNIDSGDSLHAFHGAIDEMRFSKVVRSDDWIKASYDTIANSGFAVYSRVKSTGPGFAVIVR